MSSLTEQLLAQAQTILLAVPQIAEVGARVERDREDDYSERETGSINIKPADESSRVMSESVDDNELMVEIEITVAVAQGAAWTTIADAIFLAADTRLMNAATWPAWLARVRRTAKRWGGDDGNRTPGLLTVRYAMRFLSNARAADAAPKF